MADAQTMPDDDAPLIATQTTKHRRVHIPAKLRFEVFKRDRFTCQYCGKRAPDVVLECDHIHPVALGGTNDILNLITSCEDCNGGKGAVPLSSDAAVSKQREMLDRLEERRQQIEMMIRWRDELVADESQVISMICSRMAERCRWSPSESGKGDIRKWLRKATAAEILEAWDEAIGIYADYENDELTGDSWSLAFSKVPGIIDANKQRGTRPYLRRLLYIQGILRKRTGIKWLKRVGYLEHIVQCGVDVDAMERFAKSVDSLDEFEGAYDEFLRKIGRPY